MPPKITLYALSTCAHCRKTGQLLLDLVGEDGFTHIYVDRLSGDERNETMRELRRVNPTMSFPTVVIGEEVVTGFKEERITELIGN
jgi:glutaredoxin